MAKDKEQRSPTMPAFFRVSGGIWPVMARLSAEMLSWQCPCSAKVSALSVDNPDPAPGAVATFACCAEMTGSDHKKPMKRTKTAAVPEYLNIFALGVSAFELAPKERRCKKKNEAGGCDRLPHYTRFMFSSRASALTGYSLEAGRW